MTPALDSREEDSSSPVENSLSTPVSKPKRKRRKEIAFINDKSKRNVCFQKRKKGILKKAQELCVLTGCHMLCVVASDDDLQTFTTSRLRPLLTKEVCRMVLEDCVGLEKDHLKPYIEAALQRRFQDEDYDEEDPENYNIEYQVKLSGEKKEPKEKARKANKVEWSAAKPQREAKKMKRETVDHSSSQEVQMDNSLPNNLQYSMQQHMNPPHLSISMHQPAVMQSFASYPAFQQQQQQQQQQHRPSSPSSQQARPTSLVIKQGLQVPQNLDSIPAAPVLQQQYMSLSQAPQDTNMTSIDTFTQRDLLSPAWDRRRSSIGDFLQDFGTLRRSNSLVSISSFLADSSTDLNDTIPLAPTPTPVAIQAPSSAPTPTPTLAPTTTPTPAPAPAPNMLGSVSLNLTAQQLLDLLRLEKEKGPSAVEAYLLQMSFGPQAAPSQPSSSNSVTNAATSSTNS